MSVTALWAALPVLAMLGVNRLIRRGLAAPRVPEAGVPDGLPWREASIPALRGKTLFGWFIPAGDKAAPALAILHGWGGNAEAMLPLAGPLHKAGYAVLLFDARSHGRSDGDSFASLPRFAEDLEHAFDWLRGRSEVDAALHGKVPVRIERFARPDGRTAGRGVGAITVDRPIAEVWSTIIRFDDKPEYMPRMKAVTVLEKTPERLRVKMVIDASVTTAHYTLVYRIDTPEHLLSWKLDHSVPDNSIAETDGEYRLYAITPEQTLVTYSSQVDTGRSLPRFIQDYIARRSIPDLLRAIKLRVESSGLWRR